MRIFSLLIKWIQSDPGLAMLILLGISVLILLPEIFIRKSKQRKRMVHVPGELTRSTTGFDFEPADDFLITETYRRPLLNKYPIVDYLLIGLSVAALLLAMYAGLVRTPGPITAIVVLVVYLVIVWVLKFIKKVGILTLIALVAYMAIVIWAISRFGWLNPFVFATAGLIVHKIWPDDELKKNWKTRITFILVAVAIWALIVFL